MLTVKHIKLSGEEYVYATTHVNFVPAGIKNCAPSSDSLWIYDSKDGRAHELIGGTVFVMNGNGTTVSRYDLGASNVPIADDEDEDPDPHNKLKRVA